MKEYPIWFWADPNLDHANAIEFSNRPFSSVEEMTETLIRNVNDAVGLDDQLWILGDFTNRASVERVRELRSRIACRHAHLIYGNHDRRCDGEGIFESVQYYKELKTKYGRVVLFHYPLREWSAAHYGSIHVHGHIHSIGGAYNDEHLKMKYIEYMPWGHTPAESELGLRIFDVGVDANGYRPVSLDEIARRMGISPIKDKSHSYES